MDFSSGSKLRTLIVISLALFLLGGLALYSQLFLFDLDKLSQGGITSDGGEAYAISQGTLVDGPKFKEVDINPRKVSLGDRQQLTVKMEEPDRVASVKAVTELDSSIKEIVLERNANNEWRGEWVVEDTSTKTYRTTFIALGKDGKENSFTLAWSDPCSGVPLGGDGTLSADCTISGVDGVDNGNLNLNGRTLTIPAGATFVWNSGKTITANGTIAVSGQLKKTNLWIKDADNDGYAPNATDQLAQDTQPSSYQRRYTRTGTNDCYDGNANAKPGQTSYFSSNRGDGSFDYDCNGSTSLSYPLMAPGTGAYPCSGQYSCYFATDASYCGQSPIKCLDSGTYDCGGCGPGNPWPYNSPLYNYKHCYVIDSTTPSYTQLTCR
ncbi:MAG: hypothetical protein WD889_00375 [Candidatus Colwellbacteria bacterium]